MRTIGDLNKKNAVSPAESSLTAITVAKRAPTKYGSSVIPTSYRGLIGATILCRSSAWRVSAQSNSPISDRQINWELRFCTI